MRKFVAFVAGMIILAGIAVLIIGSTVVAGMWCLHKAGLAITFRQFLWVIGALVCLQVGLRLFARAFRYLSTKGSEHQKRTLFAERHIAASPIHRSHLTN